MTRQWIVRPLAQADLDDAATWYEGQQSGLGSRFLDAVDHVLNRVRETPLQFPSVSAWRSASVAADVSVRRVFSKDRASSRDPGSAASASRSASLAARPFVICDRNGRGHHACHRRAVPGTVKASSLRSDAA
jgi:hypothetical protein